VKTLGIIPARGGSKGIPKKNIKPLNGKPLILYTIEAALKSNLTKVVVSTDDEEIESISLQAGVGVIRRPEELAMDNTPTLPVLQHVLQSLSEDYDAVMTLQPTSPLRTAKHINECIELLEMNSEADSLVSVVKVPHQFTPGSLMLKSNEWLSHYAVEDRATRRQDKPTLWARNGAAVYMTRTKFIADFILGNKIIGYEMNKIDSIDIDDMEDWEMAEALIMYSIKNRRV
jgi:N-acylneuraminate cytidylyltransferase